MADPEAIEMLGRGAEAWKEWHDARLEVVSLRGSSIDLSGTSLDGSNFRGYEFSGTNFSDSTLTNCSFGETSLEHVYFEDCDLSSANFNNATLRFVQFVRSNLHASVFSHSLIRETIFRQANLGAAALYDTRLIQSEFKDVQFHDARFGATVLADCKLERLVGLDSVEHVSHSTIDIQTLLSVPLPEPFLRGIGLPDAVITYLGSLKTNPIEYYSCFLSYSSEDDDFARRLYNDLQGRGIRTWFAPEDLKIGDRFRLRIDESIRIHDKLVLILSARSVTSDWVETEVETALEHERRDQRNVLFPIAIDESGFEAGEPWAADIRRKRHIGDFRKWKSHDDYRAAFERLTRDLKKT